MKFISTKGKHVRNVQKKSAVALLLSTCLIFPYLIDAATAFQTGEPTCPAHPEHDAFCNYAEYVPGSPCMHEHDDSCYRIDVHNHTAECYEADDVAAPDEEAEAPAESMILPAGSEEDFPGQGADGQADTDPAPDGDGQADTDPAPDGDGAETDPDSLVRRLACGLDEGEEVRTLDCPHDRGEHTVECGYAEEIPGADCEHHCELCPDGGEPEQQDEEDGEETEPTVVTDEAELIAAAAAGGAIRLGQDFDVATTISISNGAVVLDLDGHTIRFAGKDADNLQLFKVISGGEFTIMDSAFSDGSVQIEQLPDNNVDTTDARYENGTLTYYQSVSTVDGDQGTSKIIRRYTVSPDGCLISENTGTYKTDALIRVEGGTFHLERGLLANIGGEHNILSINNGVVNMSGGYLVGASTTGNGGGILAGGNSGNVTVSGGVIAANRAAGNGGGIHFGSTGALTVSGEAVITGNHAGKHGGGIHTQRAGVLRLENKVVISGNRSADTNHACDSIAVAESSVLKADGTIDTSKLTVGPYCEIEGIKEVTRGMFHSFLNDAWEQVKDGNDPVIILDQSYTGDLKVVFPYVVEKGVSFKLDLNGNSVEYSGVGALFVIEKGGSLTVCDSKAGPDYYGTQSSEAIINSSDTADFGSLTDDWRLTYYQVKSNDVGKYGETGTKAIKYTLDLNGCGKLFSVNDPDEPQKTTDSIVEVSGGAFKLESGVIANRGGTHNILSLNGGTVEMEDGYVIGAVCRGGNGGGILAGGASGDVKISGGVITANRAEGAKSGTGSTGGAGGGIFSSGIGKVTLTGEAVVSGNSSTYRGGGIAHSGTENIEISGNAVVSHNRSTADNGGGISHYGTGDIILSGDAMVSCNNAQHNGGGVSNFNASGQVTVRDNAVISYNTAWQGGGVSTKALFLEGGTVDHNTARHVGGGIMVSQGNGYAKITGTDETKVYITNNTALDGGKHGYAGGGIFVEHPDKNGGSIIQSRALIANALITDNHAQYGGGIAGCGTSEVFVFAVKGAAIFGNTASQEGGVMEDHIKDPYRQKETKNAQDIYCASNKSMISKIMLSMKNRAEWSGLQGPYGTYSPVSDSDWKGVDTRQFTQPVYLTSKVAPETQEEEKSIAKVIISGNTSKSGGGGIGGNGHIQLGVERALIIEKKVNSILDADKVTQFPFQVELTQDGKLLNGTFVYTIVRKNAPSETHEFSGGTFEFKLADGDRITIYGLPEDDKPISYKVTELLENSDDYEVAISGSDNANIPDKIATGTIGKNEVESLLFTNNKRMDITVKKEWKDNDNPNRPERITVELLRRNNPKEEFMSFSDGQKILDASNGWEYRWENLDGTYEYLISEVNVPDGYTSIKTVSADRKDRTLTNFLNATSLTVKKEWYDDNPALRPPSVRVVLIGYGNDGEAQDKRGVTLSKENNWEYTWTDLPEKLTWRVEEVDIEDGYTYETKIDDSGADGIPVLIINTYVPPKGNLTVQKRWFSNDPSATLPEIEVQLLRNGELYDTQKLNSGNSWRAAWENLLVSDMQGNRYQYTVHEIEVPGNYIYSGDKTVELTKDTTTEVFISNVEKAHLTSLNVRKEWVDEGYEDRRPESVTVQLLRNGAAIPDLDPLTLSGQNQWRAKWEKLPVYDEDGQLYRYTVQELNVPDGYQTSDQTITLEQDEIPEVTVTNTANEYAGGSLSLSKRVAGAQTDEQFTFTFQLKNPDGTPLEGEYPYSGSHSGTIRDGGTVQLKHGEQIHVTGLPAGTRFIISETVRGNYVASVRTDGVSGLKAGSITEGGNTVEYTNTPPGNPNSPGVTHPPHEDRPKDPPKEDPKEPDSNDPENPPTDPENPPTDPETPPDEPEAPGPEVPENPEEEPEYPTELPDPNLPGSPERITIIDENGVPRTYLKVWDPEEEEWVYLPEDEIPLAAMDGTPQTGDGARPVLWGGLCAASLGVGFQLLPRSRKKRRIRRRRRDGNH